MQATNEQNFPNQIICPETPQYELQPQQIQVVYQLIENQQILQQVMQLSIDEADKKYYSSANGLPQKYRRMIKKMKMSKSSQQCTICLFGFKQNEIIKKFPCRHIFHRQCAKQWLKVNKRCPICRLDLQVYFEENDSHQKNIPIN